MDILSEYDSEVIKIDISKLNISGSLDFSRFTKLQILYCSYNEITGLVNLPESLLI